MEANVKSFLLTALNNEINITGQLFELMSEEQSCYERQDVDHLQVILKDKNDLLNQIESSANNRLSLFNIRPIQKNHHQLFEQQISGQAELLARWNELKERMEKCRTQNEINGKIISLSQRSLERTLNLFKQAMRPDSLTTYTQKGMANRTSLSMSSAKA
ncbi:MAG: flagellar protein FlgN [Gammaproteobacteria bacterium]|nr:flagellar protein FlgN [Gammaproteobacteria bacterium]